MRREGVNESDQLQGLSEALSLRSFLLRWKFYLGGNHYLHRTEEETQWTKGFCANVRIWIQILRTHIKPDAVVFPVISTLQPRHRRERKEESLEVCAPASLAYTAVSEQETQSHTR